MCEDDGADGLLAAIEAAGAHAEIHPLDWTDWTFRQQEFVDLVKVAEIALFRAGNQVGKTHVGAGLTIGACLANRIEAWVVCTSWSQAVAIMAKVWDLVPKDRVAPGQRFSRRRGFGKDNPCLEFANGSIIRFRTTNQGAEALAGATVHWIWIDEPTDEEIYRELQKRVSRNGGKLIITLTPVNRDCTWLRKLVDAGAIPEVHAPLDGRALTYARTGKRMRLNNAARTVMSDAWIAEQIRVTPPHWVPVVIHGEWETKGEGVFFGCFDPARHVQDQVVLRAPVGAKVRWCLGLDYSAADREYGQCASLSRVLDIPKLGGGYDVWVYVVDEVVMSGAADSDEFAGAVLAMLTRQGITWQQLTSVHGDNAVSGQWEQKSNVHTLRAVAARLSLTPKMLNPKIAAAKDGSGAGTAGFDGGVRTLYGWIARDRVLVHSRCTHTKKAFETWDLSKTHPFKDILDALRYSLKDYLFRYGSSSSSVRLAA